MPPRFHRDIAVKAACEPSDYHPSLILSSEKGLSVVPAFFRGITGLVLQDAHADVDIMQP